MKATFGSSTTVYVGDYYEQTGSTGRKYPSAPLRAGYYANGRRVAMRENSTVYYLLTDHLGSTAITTDSSGNRVAELRYKAWGETRYTDGTTPTTFRFTGQREDATIGLYFYNARYYDPALGRFIAPDTIVPEPGNPQSLNRYAYVYNNPLKYTDSSGHCPVCVVVGALALKAIDYGWTAWDTYQSSLVLADPKASDEAKLIASLNIALAAGLELLEPDDLLPASLPLDDITRRSIAAGAHEAIQQGGLRGGVQFLKGALGDAAPGVIRHMYDQGMFRGARSAGEWEGIFGSGLRKEAGLEVHHLIERRFAERVFGLDPADVPAVVLDRTFHQQEVTARLFQELPTGGSYNAQQIWEAYKRVYGSGPGGLNRPEWLEAIWPYFERLGVKR